MTNREWLESLTDEDLARWLLNVMPFKSEIGDILYYGGVSTVAANYTNSFFGLSTWLKENHYEHN